MSKTTIKLAGGDLGTGTMLVRADLQNAYSGVEVDYCEGSDWQGTQYRVGETQHKIAGLITVARWLAAEAVGMPADDFRCESVKIEL